MNGETLALQPDEVLVGSSSPEGYALTDGLEFGPAPTGAHTETLDVDGANMTPGVARV